MKNINKICPRIYLFVESLDPAASAAFYRTFSTKRSNPGFNVIKPFAAVICECS
jgi:hypothetical protein